MTSKKTYYGFDYEITIAVIMKHMPHFLEVLEEMKDDLLMKNGAEFEWFDDTIGSKTFGGKWADDDQHRRAGIEVTRQLIGLLFQCLPPILEPPELPFLLPRQLTKEYAADWFKDVLAMGDDHYKRSEEAIALYKAELAAKNEVKDT